MKVSTYKLMFLLLAVTLSCQTKSDKQPDENVVSKPKITSVNYPLHYFSQRIGDLAIVASFPIPSDEDPAFFSPRSEEIAIFQSSDIIFLNGAGYAGWVDKVTLPERKFVNTSKSFKDRYLVEEGAVSHSHGPEGEHEHKGYAFTTWLDMKNAKEQAASVYATLLAHIPANESSMAANYQSLVQELDSFHLNLKEILDPFIGATIFGSHPVYQYLGKGYGIIIKSEHWEADQDISEEEWNSFLEKVDPTDLKLMLWEDEPSAANSSRLESSGFQVVVFRPCGNVPETGDFVEVMNQNIENLRQGIARLEL